MNKVLVAIPTYNERDNIGRLCDEIVTVLPHCTVVVLDDNSPDGTGKLVSEIAERDHRIQLVLRETKLGIGSAHKEALRLATESSFEILVTLDADFTHNPRDIPRLLSALESAELVVGSRFAKGGGLNDWSLLRRALTSTGHIATRCLLSVPFDATGAMRAYRINSVTSKLADLTIDDGYSFFYQSLTYCVRRGVSVSQVPIVLNERAHGSSKMRPKDVLLGAFGLLWFALSHRITLRSSRHRRFG